MLRSLLLASSILSVTFSWAQANDEKDIIIQEKVQEFSFTIVKGENPVTITEKYSEKYKSTQPNTVINFSELYNDNETIDDVTIKVDDKKVKGVTPKYDYFSVENIFYSDARICYFDMPLQRNSVADISLLKTYKDPRYFTSVYFTEGYFTENKKIVFTVPKWLTIELKEFNFNGYKITKSQAYDAKTNSDIITYTAQDIPAFASESAAPGRSYIYPHILVMCKEADLGSSKHIFFKTLADQYKWYHQLVLNINDDKGGLQQKAKELTAGITNDIDKIKTVFRWVQENIRYIAFEDGIAGFKPAKAIDVLNKKYGDCKGMANLTKGLLESLGFDARLCWIGTNHIAYDYSTPSMAVDNHMICALIYKGKKYFLDATETNIALDEYAERIQGRQVLIENGDNYILERVPAVTPEQNLQVEKITLSFDGKENVKGNVSITYKGESRSDILNKIAATRKDNLQKSLVSFLSENNMKYEIEGLNTKELASTDSLLSLQYNFVNKGAASSFGKEIYFEPDYRKELNDFIIDTAKRKLDVVLPYKINLLTETSIAVPAGYKVAHLPDSKTWKHSNAEISIQYLQKGNSIEYKKYIRIPDIVLRKNNFSEWNKMMKSLKEQYQEQIIFESIN